MRHRLEGVDPPFPPRTPERITYERTRAWRASYVRVTGHPILPEPQVCVDAPSFGEARRNVRRLTAPRYRAP